MTTSNPSVLPRRFLRPLLFLGPHHPLPRLKQLLLLQHPPSLLPRLHRNQQVKALPHLLQSQEDAVRIV